MPYIVDGQLNVPTMGDYRGKNFSYKYPNRLNLKPGSPLHDKIRTEIIYRALESRAEVSNRFPSWREVDKTLTVYIPLSEDEKTIKEGDPNKPVSIVFPYSYSTLESLLTYLTMAFFQDPIFQYEGIDDDDTIGASLLELLIKTHCVKTKVPLALHTVLRDSLGYGIGVGIPGWKTIEGMIPIKSTITLESDIKPISTTSVNFTKDTIFEGNELYNVNPYMFLPDISCSSNNLQDMEYIGWVESSNYMRLLAMEERTNSSLFNVKYLKESRKRSILYTEESNRDAKTGISSISNASNLTTSPIDLVKMYVTLIPKDWELSNSESPEKWLFTLANDDVIIQCEPVNHIHGMYPIAMASPEADGYSPLPIGRMEIMYGMQNTLDFLFNSHVTNIRKTINDMLVVDPFMVNIEDIKSPKAGKIIRLRKPAWGRGVNNAVQQLVVQDVTRANIGDSSYITSMMDRISAADQSMQGSLRSGGPDRLTKSEFQGTRLSAVSRLQRIAFLISQQFMQDIGTMFAAHTQQYMTREAYVKVAGRYAEQLTAQFGKSSRKVSPTDISIMYDTIVRDGSIPGGNFSDAWLNMFSTISSSPELMQQFDMFRMFSYIATQLGAKNIEDFKKNVNRVGVTTMPDQVVANQVQAGNMIPINQIGEI